MKNPEVYNYFKESGADKLIQELTDRLAAERPAEQQHPAAGAAVDAIGLRHGAPQSQKESYSVASERNAPKQAKRQPDREPRSAAAARGAPRSWPWARAWEASTVAQGDTVILHCR